MHTAYISHPFCAKHDVGHWHPESPARLSAIEDRLHAAHLFDYLTHHAAPMAHHVHLKRVHSSEHIDRIEATAPYEGIAHIDGDTAMNAHTLDAAYHAAGGAVMAVDRVVHGEVENAFVACRPPGHHATRNQAMGFCFFNNVAVAAAHALEQHGLKRVAIVDFDVHHGNGTEDIFHDDPRVMLCSTFQHPFYPYSGADSGNDHIINVPLAAGTTGKRYREIFEAQVTPRLEAFRPEMLFISAGFDAHREDDMGQIGLVEADYEWITQQVMDMAARHAGNRIVSVLEGGYDLSSLGRSVAVHIRTLAGL
ncbi:MAG: histone deacetylase family protein [Betaproteobacteria bacterium]|nr:histone deacetylase family protein [Betaproteobacteria bacterium]